MIAKTTDTRKYLSPHVYVFNLLHSKNVYDLGIRGNMKKGESRIKKTGRKKIRHVSSKCTY